MTEKLRSLTILFFAFFGGIFFLKTTYHAFLMQQEVDYRNEVQEAAFIALFIAVLFVFWSGYSIKLKKP
jgi:hypothetical protein